MYEINSLIQNEESMIGCTQRCTHPQHTNTISFALFSSCTAVSLTCCFAVMDDNQRDSMATLDFQAMSPDWAATSAAFHLKQTPDVISTAS